MGSPGWEPPGALRAEGVRQADLSVARNPQATHEPQAPAAADRRTATTGRSVETDRKRRPQRRDKPQLPARRGCDGPEGGPPSRPAQRSGGREAAMGGPGWEPPGALRAEGVRQADLSVAR